MRQLIEQTGETVTGAIIVALRERLDRVRQESEAITSDKVARLRRISADAAGRWVAPYRSADHGDLRYDESGLPR